MSFFKEIGQWANGVQLGGWKLTKPTQYTFMMKNRWAGYNNSLSLGFETNLNNNFKFTLGFRF